ncbi:MAG TPA: hypothetical protein VGX23_25305 [Actinocrinis sp.]|nr:hypothetical protein [Actinocrinis sp.]
MPSGPATLQPLTVVTATGTTVRRKTVPSLQLPITQAVPILARAVRHDAADPAAAFWGAVTLFALRLLARGRLLPGVSANGFDAWRMGPLDAQDSAHVHALAAAMPPTARAVPLVGVSPTALPEAEPLVRAFLGDE